MSGERSGRLVVGFLAGLVVLAGGLVLVMYAVPMA